LSLLDFFQRRQAAHNCRARRTASYVAQIEGQTKVPSLATLEKLAKALNVKVGRLLE
jgi:transcriptional regulator with XRE-family HTH domain